MGICKVNAKLFASKLSSRAMSAPCTPDSKRLFPYSYKYKLNINFFYMLIVAKHWRTFIHLQSNRLYPSYDTIITPHKYIYIGTFCHSSSLF